MIGPSSTKKGFTLVETLVAISVLLIATAAPLYMAAQALKSAAYAQDQLTAAYLAQDAMEYVISRKNDNILSSRDWLAGFSGPSVDGLSTTGTCINAACTVSSNRGTVSGLQADFSDSVSGGCPSSASCTINYRDSATTAYYTHDTGTDIKATKFKRWVVIKPIDILGDGSNDEAQVTVTVTWLSRFAESKTFSVNTTIYNTPL